VCTVICFRQFSNCSCPHIVTSASVSAEFPSPMCVLRIWISELLREHSRVSITLQRQSDLSPLYIFVNVCGVASPSLLIFSTTQIHSNSSIPADVRCETAHYTQLRYNCGLLL
jgi:hypothetical protein